MPSEAIESPRFVVQYSGGIGSYLAAQRTIARHGRNGVVLLFADTLIEDATLYTFLDESSARLGVPLVRVADGRTPWQVFHDVRFMGNSRVDPCSRVLKRELLRKWIETNCDPAVTTVVLGIGWSEIDRLHKAEPRWVPWKLSAPMCDSPYLSRAQTEAAIIEDGMEIPRLYTMGFPHNNCGGFCVKAGQAHFATLLARMPERYAYHEDEERKLRAHLNANVSVMKDRRGGKVKPMTMEAFRHRIEAGEKIDTLDWGGCGCAIE